MQKYKCSVCFEPNSLANTRCTRCEQVLPWGFLHDSSLVVIEKAKASSWTRWLDLFLTPNNEAPKCRFCNESIEAEALVCPHCRRILRTRTEESVSAPVFFGGLTVGVTFDYEHDPELKSLIERFLADHPDGY